MRILKSRPLAAACLVSLAVFVASFFLPLLGKWILVGILLVLLIALGAAVLCDRRRSGGWRLLAALCMGFVLIALLRSVLYFDIGGREATRAAASCETQQIQCVILDENAAGAGYSYYTVKVIGLNGESVNFRAALECAYTAVFHVGDIIEASALAEAPKNYYDRDELTFAIADGIRLCLLCEDNAAAYVIGHREIMPLRPFIRLRDNLAARLLDMVGKHNGGLAVALFLGDRNYLDDSISTCFRRSGVSHLLALSGMHVALLMGMLTSVTYYMGLSKKGRLILLSFISLAYLALTGFMVSAIRAVLMLLLIYLSELIGRRNDPLTTLCVVGISMLLCSPSTVADGGFWMSFCSVFGLVTVLPKCNEWLQNKRISRKICNAVQGLAASTVAVISISFLSWLFCGEIAPVGIIVTVLLSPILAVILSLTPIALLLDAIPFFSNIPVAYLLRILLRGLIEITDMIAHWSRISYSLQGPFYGILLALMTLVLLAMLICPLKRKLLLVLPPLLTAGALVIGGHIGNRMLYADSMQATYTVRSSGSVLVVTDCGQTTMIDTSSGSYAMMRDAEKSALAHGATEIRSVVLTHYHRSYIYSLERLAKRRILRCIYLPMPQTESEYAILAAMRDRMAPLGAELRCYSEKEQWELLDGLTFCRASVSYLDRSVQPIVTYMLQTPDEVLTFSSSSIGESDDLSTFRWIAARTDVLILGEHGPICKVPMTFPVSSLRLLLTDSADLLAFLDLAPESYLYDLDHVTDITSFHFEIFK